MCQQHYPDWEPVPCASFEDVFAAVEAGDADLAMIPIDNSMAGRVADIHHFLPDSTLHIIGEHFLRIQFALMAVPGRHAGDDPDRAQPRARARPVPQGDPRARAHPGGLRRHRRRRPRGRRGRRPHPGRDRAAAGRRDLRPARSCATRSRTRTTTPPASWCSPATSCEAPAGNGPVVTSFIFNVRNLPAALYKALGGFATNGVNMTKLESYMVGGEFTATQFLAEVDGHPDDTAVRNALEELAFFTTDVKILGVYPADPFRAHWAERRPTTDGRHGSRRVACWSVDRARPPHRRPRLRARRPRPRARAPATPRWCTAPARRPTRWSRSCATLHERHPERAVLATRLSDGGAGRRSATLAARGRVDAVARAATLGPLPEPRGTVAVVAAGTSDAPVAAEAALTVAGARRRRSSVIDGRRRRRPAPAARASATGSRRADCLVVVAGMEGALPSVVGGLTGVPARGGADQRRVRRLVRRARRAAGDAQLLRARRDGGQHRQRLRRRRLRRAGGARRAAPADDA